jgi:hypothetical protein
MSELNPANQLIGTWKIISWERFADERLLEYPLGPDPIGLLSYDASGFVQVQIIRSGRGLNAYRNPRDFGNAAFRGRPLEPEATDEVAEAYASFAGYAGRYEINAAQGLIQHHVQTGIDPRMVGSIQERLFTFPDRNILELRVKPYLVNGVVLTDLLRWQRAVT